MAPGLGISDNNHHEKHTVSVSSNNTGRKECKAIMRPLLQAALLASGIVRTIPRALVFGPKYYQGLAVSSLYTHQQVEYIERQLKFGQAKDNIMGKLLCQSLEATKLEVGCSGSLLSLSYMEYGGLATPTWISKAWAFLAKNGMRMEENCPNIQGCREYDKILIESFRGRVQR